MVSQRIVSGDWETDNMEGKKSDSISVSATVDRVSRFTLLSKLSNHTSSAKTEAVIDRLNHLPRGVVRSVTADRGPENHGHQTVTDTLGIPVYFCNPYHSWEKGTVENTIGRLRRFLPKGETLQNLDSRYLVKIENYMNHTPRKCLNFKTPYEILQLQIKQLGALQVRM